PEHLVERTLAALRAKTPSKFTIDMADGRTVEIDVQPLSDGGSVSSFTDISDREAAQEALRLAKEQAELADRSKSQFLANMSHELRTPLNAIIGYTELIQDQIGVPHDAEAMRTDTNHILGAAKHLRQLVSDILDHARIDSGRIALNIEAMPVNGLLEEIVEISEPLAMAQNTVLSITDPGKGLEVLADDGRLRQILINLVGNAIKFTKNGDIELSAQIDRRGDAIEFSVRDTGIGIAPDELARLFQPFVQANAEIQQKFGGTGLGLSISHQLARAMGGSISATSAPGKGSAFTLTLPLAAPAQRQAA
ncbi:MAG: sensor histidine kinase, partial [Alphaproteobacteria bacterium]